MHETLEKFRYPDLLVKDYKYCAALVRFTHVTLGSMVLVSKSDVESLGELSPEEWGEFSVVTSDAERALKKAFGSEKFNYLALMMSDPHVHFHLIPRYSQPVKFQDRTYTDKDWPTKTSLEAVELSESELRAVQDELVSAYNSV